MLRSGFGSPTNPAGAGRGLLGNAFFVKGYTSYMTIVVSLRDFVDEMQTLLDEKGIAYDY